MYQSGDGGIYNLKRGGFVCDVVPDLTGTTAEKTGLAAYIKQGGCLPLMYLRIWKLHPSVENLVMQEWTPLIESIFNRHINWQSAATPNLPSMSEINWASAKPHEMLGMDKVGYRSLDKPSNDRRRYEWFDSWRSYKSQGGGCNVAEFDKFYCTFTRYGAETAIDLMGQLPGLDLPKLEKYLTKQGIEPHEVRLLSDTWRMTYVLTGREALTHEERWPKALRQRHDQLTEMYQATATDPIEQARFADGFRRIYDKYAPLQWSDGELDIIVFPTVPEAEDKRDHQDLWYAMTAYLLGSAKIISKESGMGGMWASVLAVGTATIFVLTKRQLHTPFWTVLSAFLWVLNPFLRKIKKVEKT